MCTVSVVSLISCVQHLLDERAFRIQRAVQCSVQKTVLPKDQWPTYDEDREKGRSEAESSLEDMT